MKRGGIYWYTFNAPDKRRPVLILTRNAVIPYPNAVTIAPITTKIRDIPSEVLLTPDDGMHTNCAANFDNIQTVSQAKIGKIITHLSPERLEEVRTAVNFALGLDSRSFINFSRVQKASHVPSPPHQNCPFTHSD